ncbi:hypothetical protein E2562_019079 [Oryza meyeriana var. granulata]|uniref:Uncharacterized protein n=1 Tax=Oryza meyeriana var. granulata TaxID=110450 RepID=A0A6G1CRP2_9ORYZ|nr:hypothetical protein E2562_019079 [Oryza meyeriana var. granulata]
MQTSALASDLPNQSTAIERGGRGVEGGANRAGTHLGLIPEHHPGSRIRRICPDPDPAPPTGVGPNSIAIGMTLIRTSPTSEAHISPLESVTLPPPAPHVMWISEHVLDLQRSLLRLDTDREPSPPPRRLRGPSHQSDPPPLAKRGDVQVGVSAVATSVKWAKEEGGAVERSDR